MANNDFSAWGDSIFNDPSDNSKKKPKKDPYANPLGMTETPSGITGETEDILRQSRETDRAIGEAAGHLKTPEPIVKIPEASVIKPTPLPEPDIQSHTGKPDNNTSRTRFQYGTKIYDVTPSEPDKKTRDYENSLRLDSANEAYVIPPIPPSTGNS